MNIAIIVGFRSGHKMRRTIIFHVNPHHARFRTDKENHIKTKSQNKNGENKSNLAN